MGRWGCAGIAVLALFLSCSPRSAGETDLGSQEVLEDTQAPFPDQADDDEGLTDVSQPYPLDDVLRINQIQMKGTHNSYHLRPDELATPEWDYSHPSLTDQLSLYGVRQVELDVHWDPALPGFRVYHVPVLDDKTTCDTLKKCLWEIRRWSDANPMHHVLFVLIEPKDDFDLESIVGHYGDLDAELDEAFPPEKSYRPDDLLSDSETLEEALAERGWPTLGETRGKVIFHMLDSSAHRENYLAENGGLSGRMMFVRGGPGEPWGGIVEFGNSIGHEEEIDQLIQAGYLIRTSCDSTDPEKADENPDHAAATKAAGAQIISTDFPVPADDGSYWFELEGGTPSRCNPLHAPEECTSQAIEDL